MFHPNVLQRVCVCACVSRSLLAASCVPLLLPGRGPATEVLQGRGELPQGSLSQVNPQPSLPWVFGVVLVWILASHLVFVLIASLVSVCSFVFLSFHHRFQAMQSLGSVPEALNDVLQVQVPAPLALDSISQLAADGSGSLLSPEMNGERSALQHRPPRRASGGRIWPGVGRELRLCSWPHTHGERGAPHLGGQRAP